MNQSYLRDYRALRMSPVDDGVMEFSGPRVRSDALTVPPDREPARGIDMRDFKGRVAAITGAGSGIGRALAKDLARRGAHLALCDIDEGGLTETVSLCEGLGVRSRRNGSTSPTAPPSTPGPTR